jgi:hypothetical protein
MLVGVFPHRQRGGCMIFFFPEATYPRFSLALGQIERLIQGLLMVQPTGGL